MVGKEFEIKEKGDMTCFDPSIREPSFDFAEQIGIMQMIGLY